MKRLFIFIGVMLMLSACNNRTEANNSAAQAESQSALPVLTEQERDFIIDLVAAKDKPVYVVTTLRNRYFTRSDPKEISTYFTKKEHREYIREFSVVKEAEKLLDTTGLKTGITWVSDDDIHTCRVEVRNLWPCFKNRYGGDNFYFFSIPHFSKDGKYALININYSDADKNKSRGGTSVFEKQDNKWVETAILTNWGATPE